MEVSGWLYNQAVLPSGESPSRYTFNRRSGGPQVDPDALEKRKISGHRLELKHVYPHDHSAVMPWKIIIIIIIISIIVSFMQGIYTYIPETNYVPREYSVAAILLLLFMVLIPLVSVLNVLYFYISTFRSMCAVPNMAVLWSFLTSCFPLYVAHVFS